MDIYTPETWDAFRKSGATITGFRERHRGLATERIQPGSIFLCYLTRLSRWCGVLEAEAESYFDTSPIRPELDAFPVRCKVKPIVLLEPESAIPIQDDEVWKALTITNQYEREHPYWTGFFRSSLNSFGEEDGIYLVNLLKQQESNPKIYQFTDKDRRQLSSKRKVRTLAGEVEVEVPDQDDGEDLLDTNSVPEPAARESILYQAKVACVGAQMGFYIWVPRNDKARVMETVPEELREKFLSDLPLNYNDSTLQTIEQIDVLWLKGRSMARAFEIEHTTAIYSGLLRMADLLALQPNMDIRLHIVAPQVKRGRVLGQIKRPAFSLLDRGPLYQQCSFLSYESIDTLARMEHLSYMSDTILEKYEESTRV